MMHSFLLALVAFLPVVGKSQILTQSELPIVVISTDFGSIPDEPKVGASMGIIYGGDGVINQISDPFDYYDGRIAIERRGNSTQDFAKVSYGFETRSLGDEDSSVNFFEMGADEDWILHAMYIDKTQVRIPFSFYLFEQMGHYATQWKYVELVIDGNYRGLYLLCEKIKRDDDRVDIAKLDVDEISGDDVSGGYILKIDWLDDFEGFQSSYLSQGGIPMPYQWYYPKADLIQPEQEAYISAWMDRFESAVFDSDYTNDDGERYTDLIDVNSFTDFILINELSKNSDGYKLSSYLHKDKDSKGGRLVAGPIWDFDQTYGSSLVCSTHLPYGWTYLQNQDGCEDLESMPMWWQRMMEDTIFTNHLACRWEEFRTGFLDLAAINSWIEADTALISNAIARNYTRWDDVIGEYIWIEPDPLPGSYKEEVEVMQAWIAQRLNWLDTNMPGNCENDIISSIQEQQEFRLEVFPNPASHISYIRTNDPSEVCLMSITGALLQSSSIPQKQHEIDVSEYSPGPYLLEIRSSGKSIKRLLLIQ